MPEHFNTVNKAIKDLMLAQSIVEAQLVENPKVRRLCPELQKVGKQISGLIYQARELMSMGEYRV